jgi:RNA polymerase sigma factor (sigma-70 family)
VSPSPSPLERVASGDAAAVQDCLSAYEGLVAAIARRFLRSAADTEDAVQDIFIELWQKASRFDPARGSPEAFVSTMARRRVIDRIRRQTRRPESEAIPETLVADTEELSEQLHRQEEAAKALAGLERLSVPQQQTIQLTVLEGHSHASAAEATGLPLGTVKSHVRRGLLRLREMLDAPPQD